MKELINTIHCIAANELNRANEKFPQFSSKHEGLAVIAEEVFETEEERKFFSSAYEDLKRAVFKDYDCEKPLREAERRLSAMLAEGVQVLAMLKKFRCFLDKEEK